MPASGILKALKECILNHQTPSRSLLSPICAFLD
jgi:hypothetical protein